MNGVAVDGECQGFASAQVVNARVEDESHDADGRRRPDPPAALQTKHFAGADLDDIGAAEVEVGGLLAGGTTISISTASRNGRPAAALSSASKTARWPASQRVMLKPENKSGIPGPTCGGSADCTASRSSTRRVPP